MVFVFVAKEIEIWIGEFGEVYSDGIKFFADRSLMRKC